MNVLHADGLVETERVTQLLQILHAGILSQHLKHGIAGHDVDHHKNHRENQPKRGQRIQKSLEKVPDHLGFSTFSDAGLASGVGFASGVVAKTLLSAGVFRRWILTRATRRRSISTTVK